MLQRSRAQLIPVDKHIPAVIHVYTLSDIATASLYEEERKL